MEHFFKSDFESTQTKTLFLVTQALLSDLHSKASSSVSIPLFLNLQALSTDLRSAAFSTVSMAPELFRVCFLLGVESCLCFATNTWPQEQLTFLI